MAYSTDLTSALSGATVGQLAHWRRPSRTGPAVLEPEYGIVGGRCRYSFRDLVGLRTFVRLRTTMSLQKIRKAVGTLDRLGDRDHLSAYTLYQRVSPDGRVIDLAFESGERLTSLIDRPGQQVLPLMPLGDALGMFKLDGGRVVPDLFRPAKHISVDPDVRGGYPMVENTRVPFDQVADLLADGMTVAQVRDIYPSVSAAAARSALRWWQEVEDGHAA